MLRIGFDAKRIFHNFSGLGNYGRTLVENLSQQFSENQYYLFTPSLREHPLLDFTSHHNICTQSPIGLYAHLPKFLWRSYGVKEVAKELQLDVYHGLSAELPLGKLPCKSIVTVHDTIFFRYPHLFKKIDTRIYSKKTSEACRKADTIIAISQQTADDLIQFFGANPNKIEIIYQSCDAQFRKTVLESEKEHVAKKYHLPYPYLITVGTLEPRKNIVNLIKAFQGVDTNYHLVLVGKATSYLKEIEQTIATLGLSTRVHLLTNASFSDFPALYAGAVACVYPSIFEGFGIPIIESQSVGTPVLTSNISSMPEAGGAAALYFNPLDINDIREKTNTLLHDDDLQKQLSEAGKEHVRKFHPDVISKQVMETYWQLCQ